MKKEKSLGRYNYRDVFLQGDCDRTVEQICRGMGWYEELLAMKEKGDKRSGWEYLIEQNRKNLDLDQAAVQNQEIRKG